MRCLEDNTELHENKYIVTYCSVHFGLTIPLKAQTKFQHIFKHKANCTDRQDQQLVTRLKYVTSQTFQDPTNTDSTCSIGKNKHRAMATNADRDDTPTNVPVAVVRCLSVWCELSYTE